MKLESKCFVLLAIFLSRTIQESVGSSSSNATCEHYSAFDSVSWAITSNRLSPILGNGKQSLYDDFISSCDIAVKDQQGHVGACTYGEKKRLEMNRNQPKSVYNYTQHGYTRTKTPPELYDLIKEFFDKNRQLSRVEWKNYNVYHNAWEAPPTFIDLQKDMGLTTKIEQTIRPILEKWTGQRLKPVS